MHANATVCLNTIKYGLCFILKNPNTYHKLKGQCHEIFRFWFFLSISFPLAPEYPMRTVSNFFKNSRRYSQVKVHHQYQRHRRQRYQRRQRHRRQVLPPVSLVSTTPVASCQRYQRHRRQICHRCQWHQWQIMGTISGCWDFKVNLKTKMFL